MFLSLNKLYNEREFYKSLSKNSNFGLNSFLNDAIDLSKKHKIDLANVIDAYNVLELKRRNDLYHWNGDAFDEQIAGIAELLKKYLKDKD